MPKLSVVIIVKNEARNIEACLESVQWADEIIVCDAGSQDNTVELAKRYTPNVIVEPNWEGYGIQRRKAQNHASGDWILMIDADERMTDALRTEIETVVQRDQRNVIIELPRLSWVFGRFIRHSGWYPDYVARLYRREETAYDEALVHEQVIRHPTQSVEQLKSPLLHYTYNNLEHYLVKSAHYARAWADQKFKNKKKTSLTNGMLHAIGCFVRMYIFKAGFLDGKQGLLLALLSAHSTFAKYADLWIRHHDQK